MQIKRYLFLMMALISIAWAVEAVNITSSSQLLSGNHTAGVVGDFLLKNDSISVVISNTSNVLSPGQSGGNIIDAAFHSGLDDFDLMYLYLNKHWPRQADYSSIHIISAGAPYDSAHIRVQGADTDNNDISIITDYILYDNTSMVKVVTTYHNQSSSALSPYGIGDAFSWGSNPFVPGRGSISSGSSTTSWLASATPNTLYGYIAPNDFFATHGSYWSDATLEEIYLPAGNSFTSTRYFMVAHTLSEIYSVYLDMKGLSTGSLSVTVTYEGQACENATVSLIEGTESGPTIKGETDHSGLYQAQLQTGNWICKVYYNGQTKEQSINISTNGTQELNFSMNAVTPPELGGDTLTIIQSPLVNIPTMALPGDTITVKIKLPEPESVQSLSLWFNGHKYDLDFNEITVYSLYGLRTLEAYLPSSMFYGLYDLEVKCSGADSTDMSKHALYVIPEYKKDFSFIHVTDSHMPSHYFWGDDGLEADSSELEDFRAVIEDINIIHPDFVLHTGDLINDGEIEELGIPSYSRAKHILYKLDVPLYMVAGNHDLGGWDATPAPDGTSRRTWWKFFGWKYLSSTSTTATTTQNYSFDYGNTHFVGLEAYDNYDEWRYDLYGETSFISSQLQWLSDDLAEHADAPLKILFYHMDFKSEMDLDALDVDAAFWGHIHSNTDDNTVPYSVSTGATCDGARWYRLITVSDNIITSMQTFQAGHNGELITKTVSSDKLSVTLANHSNASFHHCLVKFPLEAGKQVDSILNATLIQIDTLSIPQIVYAYVDLPANSSVTASITVIDTPGTAIDPVPENAFLISVYPNPFNPILKIDYQLSYAASINISAYNLLGEHISVLEKSDKGPGHYELEWNAAQYASGLYIIKAEIENTLGRYQFVKKCLLMK